MACAGLAFEKRQTRVVVIGPECQAFEAYFRDMIYLYGLLALPPAY
jgi:hypothetical protein